MQDAKGQDVLVSATVGTNAQRADIEACSRLRKRSQPERVIRRVPLSLHGGRAARGRATRTRSCTGRLTSGAPGLWALRLRTGLPLCAGMPMSSLHLAELSGSPQLGLQ